MTAQINKNTLAVGGVGALALGLTAFTAILAFSPSAVAAGKLAQAIFRSQRNAQRAFYSLGALTVTSALSAGFIRFFKSFSTPKTFPDNGSPASIEATENNPEVVVDGSTVVIIGGGPVGLWTALQIKEQHPEGNITIIEKYSTYKRTHHLRIDPSSLPKNVEETSPLYEIVDFLRNTPSPATTDIEEKLAAKAREVGIAIRKEVTFTGSSPLKDQFPNAKVLIGADGAHSMFRRAQFNNERSIDHDLHYIAELKFVKRGKVKTSFSSGGKIQINLFTGTLNQWHLGTYNKEKDETPITIRTFVTANSFKKMSGWTTNGNPKTLQELENHDPEVYSHFKQWLEKAEYDPITLEASKVTVTKLGCYRAARFVNYGADASDPVSCLVGDAAFGVPFFRSLNNGLLSGTQLAAAVASYLKAIETTEAPSIDAKKCFFDGYQNYAHALSRKEIILANIKSAFIKLYIFLISSNLALIRAGGHALSLFASRNANEYLDELNYSEAEKA